MVGEEERVLALETDLERLRAELTPVSLPSELARLRVLEKAGSELTRCMAAVGGSTSAIANRSFHRAELELEVKT